MNVSDWMTLAAVLIALGLGVSSLIQTQMLQKRERREGLLNEIIEWAVDLAKCGIEPGTPDLSDDKDATKSWKFLDSQFKKLDTLQLLRAKSVSVDSVALKIDTGLQVSVSKLIENLKNQLRCLYDYKKFMDEHKNKGSEEKIAFLTSTSNHVDNNNKLLYASAVTVIEEAAKIKTKDIG